MLKKTFAIIIFSFLNFSCLVNNKTSFSSEKIENMDKKLNLPEINSFRLTQENFHNGINVLKAAGGTSYNILDLGTKIVKPDLKLLSANTSYCSSARLSHIKNLNQLKEETDQSKIDDFEFMLSLHPDLKKRIQAQDNICLIVFWSKRYAHSINSTHVEFGRELKKIYNDPELFFVNSDLERE